MPDGQTSDGFEIYTLGNDATDAPILSYYDEQLTGMTVGHIYEQGTFTAAHLGFPVFFFPLQYMAPGMQTLLTYLGE